MKVQTLKATLYAIGQGLRGRQLLKNPKGTPATTVRSIEKISYIDNTSLDVVNFYMEYTKDFAKPQSPTFIRQLERTDLAFFNKEKKEFKREKQAHFYKYTEPSTDIKPVWAEKNPVSYEELEKRDFSALKEKVAKVKEEYVDFSMAFLGFAQVKEAVFDKTRAEIAVEQYHKKQEKMAQKEFKRDGFWATLIKNLKQ